MANPMLFFLSYFVLYIGPSSCASLGSEPSEKHLLRTVVLDGKQDCKLDEKEPIIFHPNLCEDSIPNFTSNVFEQKKYVACFGAYEGLLGLCEFKIDDVNLSIPSKFNDSKEFCHEALSVYGKVTFAYVNKDTQDWSDAVKKFMTDDRYCTNLCVIGNFVDPVCMVSLTAANEYLRLKGLKDHVVAAKEHQEEVPVVPVGAALEQPANIGAEQPIQPVQSDQGVGESVAVQPVVENKTPAPANSSKTIEKTVVLPGKEEVKKPVTSSMVPPAEEKQTNEKDTQAEAGPEEKNVNEQEEAVSNIQKIPPKDEGPSFEEESEMGVTEETVGNLPIQNPEDDTRVADDQDTFKSGGKGEEDLISQERLRVPSNVEPLPKDNFIETEDSYASSYFATIAILCFLAYFLFHYKNKLLALALEGRKTRSHRARGRPSSANYSKLHSNLEEAIASNVTAPSPTQVLY